jgi:hypothetical protein
MTQAPASIFKIPTKSPQPARGKANRARKAAAAQPKAARQAAGRVAGIETRTATRGDGEVIELELGIAVYPPRQKGGRWRAVWNEDGERQQCESVSEETLAAKLEKVRQRLATGAANMTRPGADLIAWYLNPDRLPVADRWSRKHADSQHRLCQRFAAPVIGLVTCQDITVSHTQKIVNAAPTAGEGDRVHRMLSAMVGAGIKGGYLVNPMLAGSTGRPRTGRCPPRRSRWRESRRCWSILPRSRQAVTSAASGGRWQPGPMASGTS